MLQSKTIFLRVKREFFDKIKSGEKTIEYRNSTSFYVALFRPPYSSLKLQCGKEFLEFEINKIELIQKPDFLKESKYVTTDKVFAIHIGGAR